MTEQSGKAAKKRTAWRRGAVPAGALLSIMALLGAGGIAAHAAEPLNTQSAITQRVSPEAATPIPAGPPSQGSPSDGSQGQDPSSNGSGSDGSQNSQAGDSSPATDDEATGVVLIDTELGYQDSAAAGTGIVISKDGLVMTNNHVVADSTSISVTIATTGKSYTAKVVGTDSTEDVAVLKLEDAPTLQPAALDDDEVAVGDDVTAVGNSGGTGELQAIPGTVTALDASVTTTAEDSTASEKLTGMIEVDGDIVAGDSGGALLDDEGEVVGMNTAASSGTPNITGYAIGIDQAIKTADAIIDGEQTETNTIGYPAFLGVAVGSSSSASGSGESGSGEQSGGAGQGSEDSGTQTPGSSGQDQSSADGGWIPFSGSATSGSKDSESSTSGSAESGSNDQSTSAGAGATVAGVYEDTPAGDAGLVAGDTITKVDSTAISDGDDLSSVIGEHSPGDSITITWTDQSGESHSASVTLTEGPAA